MKIGEKFKMTMPNGATTKVELTNIQDYPASGMPTDYEFTYLEGEEPLFKSKPEKFHLPMGLIMQCKLEKIDGDMITSVNLSHNELIEKCISAKSYNEFEKFYKKVNQKELSESEKDKIKEKLQYFLNLTQSAINGLGMQ